MFIDRENLRFVRFLVDLFLLDLLRELQSLFIVFSLNVAIDCENVSFHLMSSDFDGEP